MVPKRMEDVLSNNRAGRMSQCPAGLRSLYLSSSAASLAGTECGKGKAADAEVRWSCASAWHGQEGTMVSPNEAVQGRATSCLKE